MPDGLILLKAVRKIQTAYRAKKARRLLNDQRKLLDLTTRLEIYSERCDLWFEQGELYYYRRDYENAIISLSNAVSNIHVNNGEDNQTMEERVGKFAQLNRLSYFVAQQYQMVKLFLQDICRNDMTYGQNIAKKMPRLHRWAK